MEQLYTELTGRKVDCDVSVHKLLGPGKIKLLVIAFLILLSCNSNKKGFTITGLTSNIPDSTKIYLDQTDSTFIIKNQFHFTGYADSIKQHIIRTKGNDYKILWIDNSEILVDATKSTLHRAHISGSKFQNQNSQYLDLIDRWRKKVDSINSIIQLTNKSDSGILEVYWQAKDSIISNNQNDCIEFLRLNPDFDLGSFYITFLMFNQPNQITQEMYNALSETARNNKWGKSIRLYIEKSVDFKVGDKVVDITLPDIHGNMITLSSFKGKYVLLEFWASWCGPCKAENLGLLKMYRKYNSKGFEIVGVSLDENKEDWESAIKSDTIIWTTISDLKGNMGEAPLTYKVYGIPINYLVDPTGTITDIDLRGTSLEERLNSIFKE